MKTYPVNLNSLSQQRVVVVGGGVVACRKVKGLLAAGATVTMISPVFSQELVEISKTQSLKLESRDYRSGDLEGVFLVIAATDDPEVNRAVWQDAQQEGCLVNIVDDPAHCNFILPAQVRHGDFSIAVSTGGASPALARRLRERLSRDYGPVYGEFTALMGELRPTLLGAYPPGEARLGAALKLIDSDLIDVLERDGYDQARLYALGILNSDADHAK